MDYKTAYDVTAEGHSTKAGTAVSAAWLGEKYADCTVSVEMNIRNARGKSAGLILRADRLTTNTPDKEDKETCVQGYYVSVSSNAVTLHKYNFNYSSKNIVKAAHSLPAGEWFTLKAEIVKNTVTVYINDQVMFTYTDAYTFASGNFGLYCDGASATYRNLTLKAE